jgi:hypothetical protein
MIACTDSRVMCHDTARPVVRDPSCGTSYDSTTAISRTIARDMSAVLARDVSRIVLRHSSGCAAKGPKLHRREQRVSALGPVGFPVERFLIIYQLNGAEGGIYRGDDR